MTDILMPKLGLTMETGTLSTWYVKVGEKFSKGDALFEVESDKLTNTVEARFDGVLKEVLLDEMDECEVGAVVARAEMLAE